MIHYLYLLAAICLEVTATSFMKESDGFSRLAPSCIAILGYAGSFYLLSLTLRVIPTGIAYAIWSGFGIVLITLVAWVIRGERPDLPAMIGMALIIAGIMIMNLLSRFSPH